MDLCYVPISIGKFYKNFVACAIVDMDKCYILLGRPRHTMLMRPIEARGIYMFTWKDERFTMKSIPPTPKPTKEEAPKFITTCNQGEFFEESKETKESFALVVKEEVVSSTEIFEEIKLEHVGEPKPLWQYSATILYDFEDSFMQKECSGVSF